MRYLLLLVFFSVPVFACVHSADSTDTYVEICKSPDSCRVITYDELSFGNNHVKRSEQIREAMQGFLNSTVSLNDPEFYLDPDAAVDPDCENFYWGDLAGTKKISLEATHLVARACIIENVQWDGVDRYIFGIRSADRCQ